MRVATSPGMSRIMAKTMTLTRNSVGSASAARRRRYGLTRPLLAGVLLVEPGVQEARPEAEAVVVLEALHVGRMRDVPREARQIDVVRLVREVALDVVDDLLALLWIQLASLGDEHRVQFAIGHVASVVRLLGEEGAVEPVVHLGERCHRAHRHLLELPEVRRGDVLAVLLGPELDGDADLAQIVGGQIVETPPWRLIARPVEHRRREPVSVTGLSQEPFGLGGGVADQILRLDPVGLPRLELPLLQRTPQRPGLEAPLQIGRAHVWTP